MEAPIAPSHDLSHATIVAAHRRELFRQILLMCIWIAGATGVILIVMGLINGGAYQLLINGALSLGIAASTAWSRSVVGEGKDWGISTLSTVSFVYLTGVGASIFFHNGIQFLFGAIILDLLIISIAGYQNKLKYAVPFGVVSIMGLGVADALGSFEDLHFGSGGGEQTIMVVIAISTATLIIAIALILYVLNDTLLQSLRDSEERSQTAESAQQAMALTLAQVQEQSKIQAQLLELVRDLETPTIPVLPGVIALPIVGHLDLARLDSLTDALLNRISGNQAHTVIVDITGIALIDTATANGILQLIRSVRLLGAQCILTGIRSEVAQTLVSLGVDWSKVETEASLEAAIVKQLEPRAA